ncbi:hypothetical protein DICVIV_09969 [Dictyocaulus viviparus]|uniref:Uncharacterized protein n=1 Tax=Dictyocaulus viviparus TaxID=29172 RepID=A0A0D8XHC9_DICVI|nr:hypothetical protein DICVIV_09969 [Dictyocaulus viviparus]
MQLQETIGMLEKRDLSATHEKKTLLAEIDRLEESKKLLTAELKLAQRRIENLQLALNEGLNDCSEEDGDGDCVLEDVKTNTGRGVCDGQRALSSVPWGEGRTAEHKTPEIEQGNPSISRSTEQTIQFDKQDEDAFDLNGCEDKLNETTEETKNLVGKLCDASEKIIHNTKYVWDNVAAHRKLLFEDMYRRSIEQLLPSSELPGGGLFVLIKNQDGQLYWQSKQTLFKLRL